MDFAERYKSAPLEDLLALAAEVDTLLPEARQALSDELRRRGDSAVAQARDARARAIMPLPKRKKQSLLDTLFQVAMFLAVLIIGALAKVAAHSAAVEAEYDAPLAISLGCIIAAWAFYTLPWGRDARLRWLLGTPLRKGFFRLYVALTPLWLCYVFISTLDNYPSFPGANVIVALAAALAAFVVLRWAVALAVWVTRWVVAGFE